MADNKRIMKNRHQNVWDTIHFTTNANHMGMNSSEIGENVNKKLSEIMAAQQVDEKPVLEDKIDVIDLYTKRTMFTGNPTSTAEYEAGETSTVVPKTQMTLVPMLFKFHGKNLDKLQDKADECFIKVKSGSTDSTITKGITAVTKDNLRQLQSEYRTNMIEVGDYIFDNDDAVEMPDDTYSYCLQRKFNSAVTVGTQEKDVVYSKAIKFTPPQIIAQCTAGDTDDVVLSAGFNAESSDTISMSTGTKKLKCFMRVENGQPASDKHILKLEMFNPFTLTSGNVIAAVKLAEDDSQDVALFGGEVKYRPYDVIEFSSELSAISFNLTPADTATISIGFSNLDGITLMRGVWNKEEARLEF